MRGALVHVPVTVPFSSSICPWSDEASSVPGMPMLAEMAPLSETEPLKVSVWSPWIDPVTVPLESTVKDQLPLSLPEYVPDQVPSNGDALSSSPSLPQPARANAAAQMANAFTIPCFMAFLPWLDSRARMLDEPRAIVKPGRERGAKKAADVAKRLQGR